MILNETVELRTSDQSYPIIELLSFQNETVIKKLELNGQEILMLLRFHQS